MFDARRLATLKTVVEAGSFAAAASELGYTQSAVSQQIAQLEQAAGLKLVERRPVRATEAGLVAIRAADAAGEAIAAAQTEIAALRQGTAGSVRVGAFASAAEGVVAPALTAFARTHPRVAVTLRQVETPVAHAMLIAGELDLAVTFDYDVAPRDPPAAIERVPLGDDPMLVALPAKHPRARARRVALADLRGEPWIASPLAGLPLGALEALAGGPLEQGVHFEGDDFHTVVALVAAGRGVALLPRLAAHGLPRRVVARELAGAPLGRSLYVSRLRTATVPPVTRALEETIRRTREDGGDVRSR